MGGDESSEERPLLVFFAAPNSGRARRVEGFLAQVLQGRGNHRTFRILRVDAQERPDLVERFRVTRLPALAVVEAKRVKRRLEAPRGCEDIRSVLRPWLR
ncbi:MAG TPA: thioredoxin family protein [Gaiellaceae bacterium]|jgi:thioredoxin-like negative regulator of GroEL|nr:thioredoxin family protein [Gaiellaceae bacterium]